LTRQTPNGGNNRIYINAASHQQNAGHAPEGARGGFSNAAAQPKFPATKVKTPLVHFYRTLFIQNDVRFCDLTRRSVN
jgi:hypothetical protein